MSAVHYLAVYGQLAERQWRRKYGLVAAGHISVLADIRMRTHLDPAAKLGGKTRHNMKLFKVSRQSLAQLDRTEYPQYCRVHLGTHHDGSPIWIYESTASDPEFFSWPELGPIDPYVDLEA